MNDELPIWKRLIVKAERQSTCTGCKRVIDPQDYCLEVSKKRGRVCVRCIRIIAGRLHRIAQGDT